MNFFTTLHDSRVEEHGDDEGEEEDDGERLEVEDGRRQEAAGERLNVKAVLSI